MPDEKNKKTLTTAAGRPVGDNQNSLTAGPRGPVLIEDFHLIEKMAHFNRERIPERVVHAKGAAAFGTFTVTQDISKYTAARLFSKIGKKTEVLARFSTVAGEKGSADTNRDPRGFAVKFYTEEGNWDMTGNNTPVFFVRDPLKFSDFIHSQKREPRTNLRSATMMWDFWSLSPESLHQVTILFSERGIPDGFPHMNGYSSHTFSLISANRERFWVKWHFKTMQGIKNLAPAEAERIAGTDPDYATRDLFESIEQGKFPKWRVCVQIMPETDAANYRWHPFDLTKVWPHKDYPLREVGVMELNRNPDNYFAQVEQAAFSPVNIVPGMGYSPDKMLQARLLSYPDAHRYRLGVNFESLPANQAKCPVHHYHRDGFSRFDDNGKGSVNYEPNSFDGPAEEHRFIDPPLKINGEAYHYNHREGNDDYTQAGNLYRLLSADSRLHLVENLVAAMKTVPERIQRLQISHFTKADLEYGSRVAAGLGLKGEAAEHAHAH